MSYKTRTPTTSWRRCPECRASVKRILRTANDKRRWDAESWRRFRCRKCDWQGLLPRSPHDDNNDTRVQTRSGSLTLTRAGRAALLLLLAGVVVWGAVLALQMMTGS